MSKRPTPSTPVSFQARTLYFYFVCQDRACAALSRAHQPFHAICNLFHARAVFYVTQPRLRTCARAFGKVWPVLFVRSHLETLLCGADEPDGARRLT
jgi:hypothetical protein